MVVGYRHGRETHGEGYNIVTNERVLIAVKEPPPMSVDMASNPVGSFIFLRFRRLSSMSTTWE